MMPSNISPAGPGAMTQEMTAGGDLVVVRDLGYRSRCACHDLPVEGRLHVGFVSDVRQAGPDALGRIVGHLASHPQTPELFARDLCEAVDDAFMSLGVAVYAEAVCACLRQDGGRPGLLVTRATRGILRERDRQDDFMTLIGR